MIKSSSHRWCQGQLMNVHRKGWQIKVQWRQPDGKKALHTSPLMLSLQPQYLTFYMANINNIRDFWQKRSANTLQTILSVFKRIDKKEESKMRVGKKKNLFALFYQYLLKDYVRWSCKQKDFLLSQTHARFSPKFS